MNNRKLQQIQRGLWVAECVMRYRAKAVRDKDREFLLHSAEVLEEVSEVVKSLGMLAGLGSLTPAATRTLSERARVAAKNRSGL